MIFLLVFLMRKRQEYMHKNILHVINEFYEIISLMQIFMTHVHVCICSFCFLNFMYCYTINLQVMWTYTYHVYMYVQYMCEHVTFILWKWQFDFSCLSFSQSIWRWSSSISWRNSWRGRRWRRVYPVPRTTPTSWYDAWSDVPSPSPSSPAATTAAVHVPGTGTVMYGGGGGGIITQDPSSTKLLWCM